MAKVLWLIGSIILYITTSISFLNFLFYDGSLVDTVCTLLLAIMTTICYKKEVY